MRHAGFAGGSEKPRHVRMRASTYPRRSIPLTHVGEQEQHQQRATARGHVDPPRGEIILLIRIVGLAGKADIDVPAGIPGIVRVRETHRKAAEVRAWAPASASDELVESGMKCGRGRSRAER